MAAAGVEEDLAVQAARIMLTLRRRKLLRWPEWVEKEPAMTVVEPPLAARGMAETAAEREKAAGQLLGDAEAGGRLRGIRPVPQHRGAGALAGATALEGDANGGTFTRRAEDGEGILCFRPCVDEGDHDGVEPRDATRLRRLRRRIRLVLERVRRCAVAVEAEGLRDTRIWWRRVERRRGVQFAGQAGAGGCRRRRPATKYADFRRQPEGHQV